MFKNTKIRTKLLVVMLATSLIPFLIIGATALLKSRNAISGQAFNHLESVREIKKAQIESFFAEARDNMAVLLEMVTISRQVAFQKLQTVQENKKAQLETYFQERFTDIQALAENDSVIQALTQFTEAWQKDNNQVKGSAWQAVVNKFGKELTKYKETQGCYNLWLMTKEGNIIYTVAQGSELGENLLTGKLKDSPLSKGFQTVLKGNRTAIQDFEAYAPAENQYLAFLTAPLIRAGKVIGVLALGLSAEAINTLIQRREGMGNTEETFLVGEVDGRTSYRSDRVFKWQNRQAIGHDLSGTDIDDALAGHSNIMVKVNSSGRLDLSAYTPLQITGLHWCIITTIALEEVITPKLTGEPTDFFTKYIAHKGYYDLLLIHADGKIFYSVKHEADYGTNILNGKYADSNLGKLVQSVLQSKTFAISDYALYAPTNNMPAAFIAQPILQGEKVELIVALQLSDDSLNKIMQQRAGMGDTGETYLVGNDKLMRSNSFLGPDTHSMKASFAHPEKGRVDTESSREALRGETNQRIIKNYQDEVVLSAYTPLKVGSNTWALIAEIHQREAFAALNTLQWWLIILALVIAFLVLLFLRRFVGGFMGPLLAINVHLKILAQGRLTKDNLRYEGENEIAEIIASFNRLKEAIRSTIKQANAIAAGDYDTEIQLLSDDDQLGHALFEMVHTLRGVVKQAHAIAAGNYTEEVKSLSDKDQLGMALSNMVKTLRDITTKNAQQDWLKTGQMQLSHEMSGKQDIVTLAKNIIRCLCNYLQAQVGVFYMVVEESHSDPQNPSYYLKLLASYAYTWRKNLSNRFEFGEGMVGQAALEQQPIIIMQVPEDAVHVQSGLIDTAPRQVIIIPFLYEGAVKGVIELGFFQALTELQIDFLNQVMPNLAVAVNTAESRMQLQELLRQSQIQTEELQSQAEELQSQQEELRQTNEELEERSRELEQQQRDIQDKNRALEQSRQVMETKAKELEMANKYKSEFLANMSHELRTPLNSLLILAQLLADNKAGNLNDKQVEYARTIHSAGNDLLTLINDILDLSKVESGKLDMHPEEISLKDMVETIELKFRHVAEQKSLSFHITLTEELSSSVLYTDAQRLKQITNNLLSNAFKFTAQGEVHFTVRRPTNQQELAGLKIDYDNTIILQVTDTGIGIAKDKQDLVFEAFRQADGTTSRRFGGTGLGLSISRHLARLLGGEIRLESAEGKGSTFCLYLPATSAKSPKTAKRVENSELPLNMEAIPLRDSIRQAGFILDMGAIPSTESTRQTGLLAEFQTTKVSETPKIAIADDRNQLQPGDKTILIIDDDRNFSNILMDLTHEKNFKCLLAEDGKIGLELAEQYLPSAIILDIGLPQMNGWTVMEKLKDSPQTRHIPVHFVSATVQQNMEAKRMGAIGYLFKPVNMAELSEAFKKIEQFITQTMKNLLVIEDNELRQQSILDLVGGKNIQFMLSTTREDALQQLGRAQFDCIILDVDVDHNSGINLLEQLYQEENLCQIPVVIYAERELAAQEEVILQRCEDNLTVKTVRSPERLLDEATLFLHQLEANLPKEKRTILRRLHDKQAILANKKVLVVDDDMRNTFALTTILEDQEMQVVIAENGQEALELLKETQDINLVLMDIMMPEMDGYETIRTIRTQLRFRKLPIIALTAKAMKGDKTKCLEAGANDYLAKPIDADKLISLLRVWLYR